MLRISMKTFAAQATFIFAVAFALPAFAGKEACAAGKSDGQIILDLKNQVDNEWWNDVEIGSVLALLLAAWLLPH